MFGTIYIYVPSKQQIVQISEGSGDNLTNEDLDNGFVDYIYYEQYSRGYGFPEVDAGMVMLKELFQVKYNSTKDCIPAVLDMAFRDENIEYIVLD